jgi:hypothetical protein
MQKSVPSRQCSGRSLRTFSRSRLKISQQYAESTVCPVRTNYFLTIPFDVKENNEHALDFALHLSRPFSVSASFDLPYAVPASFPERLCNHLHGLRLNFS